jgi:hypothetical protein
MIQDINLSKTPLPMFIAKSSMLMLHEQPLQVEFFLLSRFDSLAFDLH